jgi:hypothetical protein
LSALVIRPLFGCPMRGNDILAGTLHVPLGGVADKIRGIIATAPCPDGDMIANNDQGDVMPRTPTAEGYAAIRETVNQRHTVTLRAEIAATLRLDHYEGPRRQAP